MGGPSDRFRAEALTAPVAEHGEGPVWDDRAGVLRCVDMARGDLLALPARRRRPNGLAFDADGRHATWIDTPTRRIDRVDVDPADGRWTGRSTFVEVAGEGVPDGLTVDAEGGVWVALFTGGAVRRYTAGGALDVEVPLPVSGTTACTLGGPDRWRLFVTTSARGIDPADEPLAGAVFAIDVDVPGEPLYAFDG